VNILFCDLLNQGNWTVHVHEVLSGLSKLGHNVVLIQGQISQNRMETLANRRLSLSTKLKRRILRLHIIKQFRGEISILLLAFKEIYVFLLVFVAIVKHKRRFDVIYRRHGLYNSERLLARLFKILCVKEVNGIWVDEERIMRHADRISLRITDRLERFSMPKADKIIVVTPRLKEVLQKDYGVPEDKIAVIRNGANIDLFKPMDVKKARAELGLSRTDNYVCFVGSLFRWHGVEYLIKSIPLILKQCPQTRFLIVGDGEMKQELIELARHTGIQDKVIFTAMVPYKKVPLYINASDVCVAPSVRERNQRSGVSPLKLCEYMACGKPVVTSRLSGLEMIAENHAGILVEPENPLELATAIITLLKDRELGMQMGQNGRRYVVENRSWKIIAQRVAEVLNKASATASREQ